MEVQTTSVSNLKMYPKIDAKINRHHIHSQSALENDGVYVCSWFGGSFKYGDYNHNFETGNVVWGENGVTAQCSCLVTTE